MRKGQVPVLQMFIGIVLAALLMLTLGGMLGLFTDSEYSKMKDREHLALYDGKLLTTGGLGDVEKRKWYVYEHGEDGFTQYKELQETRTPHEIRGFDAYDGKFYYLDYNTGYIHRKPTSLVVKDGQTEYDKKRFPQGFGRGLTVLGGEVYLIVKANGVRIVKNKNIPMEEEEEIFAPKFDEGVVIEDSGDGATNYYTASLHKETECSGGEVSCLPTLGESKCKELEGCKWDSGMGTCTGITDCENLDSLPGVCNILCTLEGGDIFFVVPEGTKKLYKIWWSGIRNVKKYRITKDFEGVIRGLAAEDENSFQLLVRERLNKGEWGYKTVPISDSDLSEVENGAGEETGGNAGDGEGESSQCTGPENVGCMEDLELFSEESCTQVEGCSWSIVTGSAGICNGKTKCSSIQKEEYCRGPCTWGG